MPGEIINPFIANNIELGSGFGRGSDAYDVFNQRTMGTPNWTISADQIFASTVEGEAEYKARHMCYDVDVFLSHNVQGNMTSMITSSGVLTVGNVKVYMPMGSHGVLLKKNLANASIISKIVITRMTIIAGDKIPAQEMEFNNCIICAFQQKNDTIKFEFRFTDFTDSYLPYTQDGQVQGSVSAAIDLKKWVVGDKAAGG